MRFSSYGCCERQWAFGQIKTTKEQMMFYTSDWKSERFPDGRPKIPDSLLERTK
jgi:4-hydroxy-4-methyl-2-oxoglutarate aldolase